MRADPAAPSSLRNNGKSLDHIRSQAQADQMHVSVGAARAWLDMVSAGETASMPVKAHRDIGMDGVALKTDRLSPRDGGITGHKLHPGRRSSMQAVQLSNVQVRVSK